MRVSRKNETLFRWFRERKFAEKQRTPAFFAWVRQQYSSKIKIEYSNSPTRFSS